MLYHLQAAAMFSPGRKAVRIQSATGQFTAISKRPVAVTSIDQDHINQALRERAGKLKQEHLMQVIGNLDWTGFEWFWLKDYLLHYIFPPQDECLTPVQEDECNTVPLQSQWYKVAFLEITRGDNGGEIINKIVKRIVLNSKLPEHEAFFLVLSAIINHVDRRKTEVHPNSKIAQQLEEANQNYTGDCYQPPSFYRMEDNIKYENLIACLQQLKLMEDLTISDTILVNPANALAELFYGYSDITPPAQLLTAINITVSAFINAYPSDEQSKAFMWLVGQRLDNEPKPGGGFYQREVQLRQAVKQKMCTLHSIRLLQIPLAIIAMNGFGFNYLTDDKTTVTEKVIMPADTMREDLFAGYRLMPDAAIKGCHLNNLLQADDVFNQAEEIARLANISEDTLSAIKGRYHYGHEEGQRNYMRLLHIVVRHGANQSIRWLKGSLERLQLRDALLYVREWFYEYAGG